MSEKLQQLASLTTIRKLVERDFPGEDFYYINRRLCEWVELEDNEEIEYDESREMYVLKTVPICKVCGAIHHLTEIPTLSGSFYICTTCRADIASTEPVSTAV